jgi:hypothetical protein
LDEFENPIISWQRITQRNNFYLTAGNYLVLDSMAYLSNLPNKKSFLLNFLNSKIIYFLMKIGVHEYGETGFRLSNQYVLEFPIPTLQSLYDSLDFLADTDAQKNNVDKILYSFYKFSPDEILYLSTLK